VIKKTSRLVWLL